VVLTVSHVEVNDEWFLPYVDDEGRDNETSLQWMHLRPPRKIEEGQELICAFDERGIMVAAAVILKWKDGNPSQIKLLPGYPETILLRDVKNLGFTKPW